MAAVHTTKSSEPMWVEKSAMDTGRRLVFGWAMVAKVDGTPYTDTDKSHLPQDVILDSSLDFMLHSRVADQMHLEKAEGVVVYALPLLDDVGGVDLMGPAGITSTKKGLYIGVQFSPAVFAKFQSGEYTGFSVAGDAMAEFYPEGTCPACRGPATACGHGVSS